MRNVGERKEGKENTKGVEKERVGKVGIQERKERI